MTIMVFVDTSFRAKATFALFIHFCISFIYAFMHLSDFSHAYIPCFQSQLLFFFFFLDFLVRKRQASFFQEKLLCQTHCQSWSPVFMRSQQEPHHVGSCRKSRMPSPISHGLCALGFGMYILGRSSIKRQKN